MFNMGDRVSYHGGIQGLWDEKGTIVGTRVGGNSDMVIVSFENNIPFTSSRTVDRREYKYTMIIGQKSLKHALGTAQDVWDKNYNPNVMGFIEEMIAKCTGTQMDSSFFEEKIYTPKKKPMAKIVDFFKNQLLDADSKLLREMGLECPTGEPTELGLELSENITYKANRATVIETAKAMKAEQDAAKK
jgi:hypothetical protein